MNVTREYVENLVQPGDVISVEYLRTDLVATGISLAEEGRATHALCCLGGLDVVEAAITGVQEVNLRNYLRGNCVLTIRRGDPAPTPQEARKVTKFWLERVNDPYDLWMIAGMVFILMGKHLVGLFSERAAAWVIRRVPNVLASRTLSTCAELGARGLWCYDPHLMPYVAGDIYPELLRVDPSLRTEAVLVGAVLVD